LAVRKDRLEASTDPVGGTGHYNCAKRLVFITSAQRLRESRRNRIYIPLFAFLLLPLYLLSVADLLLLAGRLINSAKASVS
jgi:hypothetical protein